MPYFVGDFLDEIERELQEQRRRAAREVDRAQALYEFRNRALSASVDLNRAITAQDVFSSAKNEQERAELRALANRIAPDYQAPNPAYEEEGEHAKPSPSEHGVQDDLVTYPTEGGE